MPSKTGGQLLAAAARTATNSTSVQTDREHRGVRLFLNVTANPAGVETLTVSIEMVDPVAYATGAVTSRAITAYPATTAATNATYVYELYPGAVETAATANHEVQGGTLPTLWRATVTHSSTGSWTYTLGYEALL
jgi:hypothetical protein